MLKYWDHVKPLPERVHLETCLRISAERTVIPTYAA